jgi:hypothetical protein
MLPPPSGPWGVLADELDAIAVTPPATERAELDKVRDGGPLAGVLRPLYQDPATQLPTVVRELQRYWQAAIQPVWDRLRALCMADLAYRMEQFASGGLARVLTGLHPDLTFERDLLQIDKPHHATTTSTWPARASS